MQSNANNSSIKHLAHDLNNIFTRILNSIELLKRKVGQSDEVISLLNNIEAGTYLASEIIEDEITVSNNANLTRRININSVINDVIKTFNPHLKNRIHFELELDQQLNLINGKFSELYRIILNLITNSIEAIESTGTIKIATRNHADKFSNKIILEIHDNGAGIDPEVLPNVFDENFSTKNKNKISGIGLTVVKKMVEQYNGTIDVQSAPMVDTSFVLTFPAQVIYHQVSAVGNRSIIIAEDESITRELLAELLQSYGYKIVTVSSGIEAVKLLQQEQYDLLIIDQKMPEMNGIDCIRELRKNNHQIPVVLASGSPANDLELQSELNIQKILNKPYNFEEMLSIVRELLS